MMLPVICTAAVLLLLLQQPPQTAALSTYGCSATSSQRTLPKYGRFNFRLDLSPASSSYLRGSMDCGIQILGNSDSRWLITIDSYDLSAYRAEFTIREGGSGGKQVAMVTGGSWTPYRQVGINSGSFNVRLTTKSSPAGLAKGVMLTVEHLDSGECPSGWYLAPGSKGYCYGVPKLAQQVTYTEAGKGCNTVLANLVMGNFDYDSISMELYGAPTSMLNSSSGAHWVGLYDKDGDLQFLNKYKSMDSISGRMCSYSSDNCKCIAYKAGKFYRDDCESRHKYICYMPVGGSGSYYNLDSLVATATSIVTTVAIVLSVLFILAVLVSLVVVLVCCCRRRTHRGTVHRSGAAAAATTAGVIGVSGQPSGPAPPPYPMQAPPYTIPASSAPPYNSTGAAAPTYENAAFAAGAGTAGEKPPPYSGDWSGHNVPA